LDDVVQEMADVDEQVEKCKDIIRQKEQLSKDLDNAQKILDNQKEIFDRLVGENEANIATKAQLEAEIVSTQSEVKKLETMKDYLDHIKFTLKDENVKQYAISAIVPFLQQQTNHYLAETGHNYYIELDNWLDGTIKGFGVGDCDFGNMSGGEGKSIDLSLKFAMMDVARRQAGSYLDVLVLDELLDSSIDSHGLEKVVDIINMKQREDDLKVFIVSHREEVASFGADRIYQVVKENGMSTIGLIDG
jgi:DNA repair exonuclease SbcCD ATPase subunit